MTSVSRAAHNTPPTSNYVAATYVQLLYDYLEARGQDARALLGPMPVERSPVGLERVALGFWEQSLATASALLGDPALGVAVARLCSQNPRATRSRPTGERSTGIGPSSARASWPRASR